MLEVIKPGPLSTIQDIGRQGLRHLGVSQAGVIDPVALKLANTLLSNDDDNAAIEVTIGLCEFHFHAPTNFVITGADLNAALNDEVIYPCWRYSAKAGDKLTFKQNRDSLRAYLVVEGGFTNIDKLLGSYSTDLMTGFGGISGRALKQGDKLSYTPSTAKDAVGGLQPSYEKLIHFIPGPHLELISKQTLSVLNDTIWKVNPSSNRMGIRLSGHSSLVHAHNIATQAVHPGVIQLPPSGEPIILLNDCQTTGGYPIIGTIIQADMRHLSQLGAGDCIHLKSTSLIDAAKESHRVQAHLNQLRLALKNKEQQND
ncbi:biotin-dependent carboxyltransferase family protein [Pseudoalteromonas sp. L23]|uniref:5-oxoprolinase subunit C family protein n=1 Tax=unclassified Pseudoalteromonas TaxID=194690 RepID=UPI001F16AD36|nr:MULTISPECIES: biotin-dependent carboxyltransferase family protein [unclassified Pseudoalteromonas]MCF2827918.1 biotin-dependent carboxyltransferase family protein [Pseudoalteromonas sp. OF5H-5]MCF2833127.1 biotin-dependent carboxyltransferase family protein [Pseudoalteromonas sp. DL2-H6]MCF2926819.1 biotin-dependent carboxyltransferase family protein [Pseudoalteromonas sp. DL2-H1]MCF7512790.1 biotin-dependent carboxyltransferase family protein [Pseudoalteromonas sp. L7]MCF7524831.1 biotin-d